MPTPRPFFDTAREIRRGQFLEDSADKLQEVVAFVAEHGKPAELVIKIKVKPASKAIIQKIQDQAGAVVLFGKPEAC